MLSLRRGPINANCVDQLNCKCCLLCQAHVNHSAAVTRVTFCLMPEEDEQARQRLSCKLASKFCYELTPAHIHTSQSQYATQIDDLLWEYPQDRFVPHVIANRTLDQCLVTVGYEDSFDGRGGVLINTTQEIPVIAEQFDEIYELVLANERPRARNQFREYRSRQYELHHQELDKWD